jgi:hypothetical protein
MFSVNSVAERKYGSTHKPILHGRFSGMARTERLDRTEICAVGCRQGLSAQLWDRVHDRWAQDHQVKKAEPGRYRSGFRASRMGHGPAFGDKTTRDRAGHRDLDGNGDPN